MSTEQHLQILFTGGSGYVSFSSLTMCRISNDESQNMDADFEEGEKPAFFLLGLRSH